MSVGHCPDCHGEVIWARTLPARAMQALDPAPAGRDDERATVAVHRDHLRAHYARTLTARGARPLEPSERRHVPHAATCPARPRPTQPAAPQQTTTEAPHA